MLLFGAASTDSPKTSARGLAVHVLCWVWGSAVQGLGVKGLGCNRVLGF